MEGPLEVLSQSSGIRPNMRGHFPVLGFLNGERKIACFNGLGSKGALWGPWCAKALADYLCEGKNLPKEVDAARFA
jgi:glycine/D-amino acid oxidase-like deaminating enzyme